MGRGDRLAQTSRCALLGGIRALSPLKTTTEKGLCLKGASQGVWDSLLSSYGPRRGEEAASPHCSRGRRGRAPSLTILEGVDVAKNPQPVVLPLGRHGQLLHCGAGLGTQKHPRFMPCTTTTRPLSSRGLVPLKPEGTQRSHCHPDPSDSALELGWLQRERPA